MIFSTFVHSLTIKVEPNMICNLAKKFHEFLDICKQFSTNLVDKFGNIPRRGPKPKMSDLEIIALGMLAEYSMIDSENYFFALLQEQKSDFHNLISRRQFNDRRKATSDLCEKIRLNIARCLDGKEYIFCIDSKPVPVCKNSRAKRSTLELYDIERAPNFGYCAAQNYFYFGYKLHILCGISGVIHSYDMTKASVDDREWIKDLKYKYLHSTFIGDKGYLKAELKADLFTTCKICLEVPYRIDQKAWKPTFAPFKKARKRVEIIFSQLNDQFHICRNYAKRSRGFFTRIIHKISAFTAVQFVNRIKDRALGHVKYAMF